MKSPAFQFYPDDFLGSGKVGVMTPEEVGAYMLLLCLDWNENGFVFDAEELARWCRMTRANFRKVWKRVSRCFDEKDGRMYNPRLQIEREKQAEWRAKSAKGGKRSGEARAKGGSTTLQGEGQPNGNTPSPSPTPVTAKATASPRPSAAGSVVRTIVARPPTEPAFALGPYLADYDEQFPGADVPAGRFGKVLKRLDRKHGPAETRRRWKIFLPAKGELGPEYFGRTWSMWDRPPSHGALNGAKPTAAEQMAASLHRVFTPSEP